MLNKFISNKKMLELLENITNHSSKEELQINMQQLNNLFSPSFQKVKDCIIITEKNVDMLEASFEDAIKMYMDKTGYEASNTETRINSYFENTISMATGTEVAILVLEIWGLKLKQMDPDSKFCLIICSDEERVEVRFHKLRDDESGWLSENLDSYEDGAIGYSII